MNSQKHTPDAATGFKFATKRDVADMMQLCTRTVDNLMAEGMPYLRLGSRRVRFNVEEVKAWLKERYSTQRLGKEQQ